MLSLEEREIRRKQLGASEIHKILNFDSQIAQDLWELKLGLQDYEELDNDAITSGNILEEDCLKYYEKVNNCELIFNERIEHKRIKGLVVSLDAREKATSIPIENKVINEKTFRSWVAKRSYNAIYEGIRFNIPIGYYCQVQIQMAVLEVDKGILNVNTLTDEEQEDPINVIITDLHNKQIEILRNEKLINELEKRAEYFIDCIIHKKRPNENDYLEKEVY
jgi:hypothetical protein|nr:MAG TPA: Exonuclease [Caudoviricetes sp.]